MTKDNYYMVTFDKEISDSFNMIEKIKESGWLQPDTLLINCFPEYSSRFTYLLSHKLSFLNNNVPFEVVDLSMPYPTMVQVWDNDDLVYKIYIKYLADWCRKYLKLSQNFLFVGADEFNSSFSRLKTMLKGKIDNENHRFATVYKPKYTSFLPDYFGQEYEGKLLFQWENIDNPNK